MPSISARAENQGGAAMGGHAFGRAARLALILWCCVIGWAISEGRAAADDVKGNYLDDLLKQEAVVKKPGWAVLKPDLIVNEIAIGTGVAQGRSVMEGHGFNCWSGVAEGYRRCV